MGTLALLISQIGYLIFFTAAHESLTHPRNFDSEGKHKILGYVRFAKSFPSDRLIHNEKRLSAYSALIDACYTTLLLRLVDDRSPPQLDLASIAFYALAGLIVGETHFYFTHRLLHRVEWLWVNVHSHHHASVVVDAHSSLSFHPLEGLIYYSQYLAIFCFVPLSVHFVYAAKIGVVLGALINHLGFGGYGAQHHYSHHKLKIYNFGGVPTGLWDKLLGTECPIQA